MQHNHCTVTEFEKGMIISLTYDRNVQTLARLEYLDYLITVIKNRTRSRLQDKNSYHYLVAFISKLFGSVLERDTSLENNESLLIRPTMAVECICLACPLISRKFHRKHSGRHVMRNMLICNNKQSIRESWLRATVNSLSRDSFRHAECLLYWNCLLNLSLHVLFVNYLGCWRRVFAYFAVISVAFGRLFRVLCPKDTIISHPTKHYFDFSRSVLGLRGGLQYLQFPL